MSVPGANIVFQTNLLIPPAIAAGIASGELFLKGSVVRKVANGTIHMLLDEVPEPVKVAQEAARRAARAHPKLMVPVVLATAAVGAGAALMIKKRQRDDGPDVLTDLAVDVPPCVSNFEASLRAYVDAGRHGTLDAVTVDRLLADLDEVRAWADGGNAVEFSFEQLEPLFSLVIEHTAALARDYSVVPAGLEHQESGRDAGIVVQLRQHLEAQKKILGEAA